MNMATKQVIIKENLAEYLSANKAGKGRALDTLCSITGFHRKAVIQRLSKLQTQEPTRIDKRGRRTIYGPLVTSALKEVWNIASCICAERLQPEIVAYVAILQRDKMWSYDALTTKLLLQMSVGTMKDRLETFERIKKGGGRSLTKSSDLKELIPIRRGPWANPPPGKGEVDTVAHCGSSIIGDFCYTVQYTDVATIWSCLAAQWNKGEQETLKSIRRIRNHLPFSLLGLDPDSGSEFINWHLKAWADQEKIELTRTRPYMKNDHARIEQKNYANIRHFLGYARYDKPELVRLLNELYDVLEDYLNFFIPSMKCIRKERVRSRTIRIYDKAKPAYRRVLENLDIANETKDKLSQKYATLNPKTLKQKIDRILDKISKIRSKDYFGYGNT